MASLNELLERLRFRIGETDAAASRTWSEDELKMVLNLAQVECAKDLHQHGREWSTKMQYRIPVQDDAEYYLAPADFMFEERIAHLLPNYSPKELIKNDVDALRMNTLRNQGQTRYEFYEVQGRASGYIGNGTVILDSNDDGRVNLRDPNLDTTDLRIGDIVHNVEDQSYAEIASFGSGFAQLDNWQGGRAQRFYTGSTYRIQRPERDRHQIFVWPVVKADSPIVYDDVPTGIVLNKDILVTELYFQATSLPSDWQDDDFIVVSLKENGTLRPQERWGQRQVRIGYNKIQAVTPFRMAQNATYEFEFVTRVNPDNLADNPATISKVRIEIENKNFLEMNYVALPRELTRGDTLTEFPAEYVEPLVDYAKMLAFDKLYPKGELRPVLRGIYEQTRDSTTEYKIKARKGGNDHVAGPTVRHYESNPGYTRIYGNV